MFDQAQQLRIGQRTGVEQPGLYFAADEDARPEAPYQGQLIFRLDLAVLELYDGDAWLQFSDTAVEA